MSAARRGGREALELRFHFGERDRDAAGRSLDLVVMDACQRHGVRAAALLRGVEGFGSDALVRTERLLSLSEDAPLVAVAVGETGRVEALAAEVRGVAGSGLLVLAGLTTTGTPTTSAAEVGAPVAASEGDGRDVVRVNLWGPRDGGRSPHRRAVDAFRRHGADAASVLLGVDGVLRGERRRARFVASNRGVPAITVAVGKRDAIDAALAEVGPLADLVTIDAVEDSSRIARAKLHTDGGVKGKSVIGRQKLHSSDSRVGVAEGTRVTLVTSEIARSGAGPRYLELIHALRREGATGATALRGVWGFRGDEAPHGDRVLALRRDVPVLVEVVDMAERSSEWLGIAHGLAEGPDVVYSQRGLSILTLE